MEPLFKMEIFFMITSVFVAVLTVIIIIAGYYLIKTLRNFSKISEQLKDAAGVAAQIGIYELATQVKKSKLFSFMFGKPRKQVVRKEE